MPSSGVTASFHEYALEPTAPISTALAPRQASSVSGGSGSPVRSSASEPSGYSVSSASGTSTATARVASRMTSAPMPSPGRQAIFMWSSPAA
jgi:hypothetical protein